MSKENKPKTMNDIREMYGLPRIEDNIKYDDYWERVQEKDKEIERLNKIIEGLREERDYLFNKITTESNYEIERLKIIEEKYKDSQLYIKDFKDEIERLNNIINELEKWSKEMSKGRLERTPYDEVWIKIKELKGNDKE